MNHTQRRTNINHPDEIARREQMLFSTPPRIPPLSIEEMTDDLQSIIEQITTMNSAISACEARDKSGLSASNQCNSDSSDFLGNLPEIVRIMLRHPRLFLRQADMGIQLLSEGAIPAYFRELAILRIGWLCQAPYEWGEHVIVAKAAGVSSETIHRITQGSDDDNWSECERNILKAVEELYAESMISDETWLILAHYFDNQQLIELPILVGQYQTVAYYQNSLKLSLHEGNKGLSAR